MLPARTLTFQFDPVVTAPGAPPQDWEVVLVALTSPLDGTIPDVTLVGGRQTQRFTLGDTPTTVVFDVVPSDAPGLASTVWYRVGWRPRFFGKLVTYDFTMPDADLRFDQLQDLGAVLGSEVYLRQSDLNVHVAALDAEGYVLDGNGQRIGLGSTAAVEAAINQERIDRQQADNSLRTNLESQIQDQVAQTLTTATARINTAVSVLQSVDVAEQANRIAAVAALNQAMTGIAADLNASIAALAGTVANHGAQLPDKADLVGGVVPTSQIPTLALTTAVPVSNQAAMLALTNSQVQPGDLAVRPDGTWLLLATPTATLSNWIRLSSGGDGIQSINGQSGSTVVLGPADVGAIALGAMLPQTQITNLVADLAAKASVSTVTGINSRLTGLEADTTLVRTVSGLIAKTLMPTDVVFVDGSGVLKKKDGTVVTTGGPGTVVDWSQVVNPPASFPPTIGSTATTAVAGNDARLTNARTPTAHAASHAAAGSDPLTLTTGQISGLSSTLTNYGNRINALETSGGGTGDPGGGTGSPAKSLWFDAPSDLDGVTNLPDFQTNAVLQKGPFGQAADNTFYYHRAGADNGEWRWPMLTPNGHLKLIKWDETAPPDPVMATAASVTDVANGLALKADTTTVSTLASTVAAKADASVVSALQTTVAGKADGSTVSTLATTVAGKADAATVAAKADGSTVTALAATVAAKADTSAVNTALAGKADASALAAKADTSTVNSALALKADASTVAAKADTTAVTAALALKYDTSAATAALAGKADLVGGFLASSQIPALAINDTWPVANRAGMLALTTSQVQKGDVAIIQATADKGTYLFTGTNPATFTDWTPMSVPADAVQSVNGQTGNPVLTAADVNARSASVAVPLADVSGLTTALANKYDTTTATAALAGKTAPADVQALISQSANKQLVDLVATTNIASLSGVQSVDGSLVTAGQRILVTAQSSSVANGVYLVPTPATGAWTRVVDMSAGDFFAKGMLAVAAGTTGTNANANTVWIQASASGVVGTNANSWVKVLTAGPPVLYTAAANSGLTVTGTALAAKTTTGVSLTTAGLGVDHTRVPFIYTGDVPPGSATPAIAHGLGTKNIASVVLRDKTSDVMSLIGWTATDANTITLDFGPTAPLSGQWVVTILG